MVVLLFIRKLRFFCKPPGLQKPPIKLASGP